MDVETWAALAPDLQLPGITAAKKWYFIALQRSWKSMFRDGTRDQGGVGTVLWDGQFFPSNNAYFFLSFPPHFFFFNRSFFILNLPILEPSSSISYT